MVGTAARPARDGVAWAPGVGRYLPPEDDPRRPAYEDLARFAWSDLHRLGYKHAAGFYAETLERIDAAPGGDDIALAILGLSDRFFLLTTLLRRPDALHPWLYGRCREVEADPDGYLDLWAREHYKSTIITFAGIVQEILRDPEITIGLFSHARNIAIGFLKQIKRECEENEALKRVFRDVLWSRPAAQAAQWAETAIIVRRAGNPKEATIEAWGVVDNQPTSKHFGLLVYDDIVTKESVTSPEMVKKVTESWELSTNLGADGGRMWLIGTRYKLGDTYQALIDRGTVRVRMYPATDDGTLHGRPVFLTDEKLEEKKKRQPTTFAAQMLQNPGAGSDKTFSLAWLRGYSLRPPVLTVCIMGDPSKGRSATSDRTAIAVVGLDPDGNKYLLDGVCHRMDLHRRWQALRDLHRRWQAAQGVRDVSVGWEAYGLQTDMEHFEDKMRQEEYSFAIKELSWPRDGAGSKVDRVERLVPDMKEGRWFVPAVVWHETHGDAMWRVLPNGEVEHLPDEPVERLGRAITDPWEARRVVRPLERVDTAGARYDLTRTLMGELVYFPFGAHDDLCDAASRIYDMDAVPPTPAMSGGGYVPPTYVDGA